jgi:hypothetical protein
MGKRFLTRPLAGKGRGLDSERGKIAGKSPGVMVKSWDILVKGWDSDTKRPVFDARLFKNASPNIEA